MMKQAPRNKIGATLSIAMDRFFGLLAILFLAGISFALRFKWLTQSRASIHVEYVALGLLGAGVAFLALLFWLVRSGLVRRLPKAMPFRKPIVQFVSALLRYRSYPAAMALAFVITVVAHVAYYAGFYCAGQSLRVASRHAATLTDILSIMPLVNTITAVPISIGGAGVRETLFQELLGNLAHVPPGIAAFTASMGYANQISWALIGGVVFLLSQKILSR